MKKIMVMVGTRPEAIKMAPVIMALRERRDIFAPHLCSSGQHGTMLEQTLGAFGLCPDSALDVMRPAQTLAGLSARLFESLDHALAQIRPDAVLVQGDTTTVQVAALSAFYRGIPVGHVEAGLRTGDMHDPFPEELNRRIVALAATWHYAPTQGAYDNLLAEGVEAKNITITGNTGIDALYRMQARIRERPPLLPERLENLLGAKKPYILVTGHRRENFGQGVENMCEALIRISAALPGTVLVWPVHLNPRVRGPVMARLDGIPGILLEKPVPYAGFVRLLESASIILTDSGGIQEEAAALGKPVLVMRATTERPEGATGGSNLVGTMPERITEATVAAFTSAEPRHPSHAFGDGHAAERIVAHLADRLCRAGSE